MNKQFITNLEDGRRTTGILQFYKSLPIHIVPIQKTVPPYLPVTNGYYGYQGVLLHDQTLDRIQCHICGRWFKCLSAHLRIHDIDHVTYKDRFGLYRSEPLARLTTLRIWELMNREKRQVENLKGKDTKRLNSEDRKEGHKARNKDQWRNKYGTCKAQLGFRLKQAIEKHGHVPNWSEEKNLHACFKRRFGSWEAGLQVYKVI